MKCALYIGLPGSGKSTYLLSLPKNIFRIDDFSNCKHAFELLEIANALNQDVYIADAYLCLQSDKDEIERRIKAVCPNVTEFEYIYFENDFEKCWANVKRRGDGRSITKHFVKHLSDNYVIPEGVKVMPVYAAEH